MKCELNKFAYFNILPAYTEYTRFGELVKTFISMINSDSVNTYIIGVYK